MKTPFIKISVAKMALVSALVFIATQLTFAQTARAEHQSKKPKNVPEVIVAGDSWAKFLCDDQGYQKTFDRLNVTSIKESADCLSVSKNGLEAGEWISTDQHKNLLERIANNTQIKFVHLSIGGNDLIARWHKSFDTTQETELFERNYQLIKAIIDELLEQSSEVKVVLSGYDYARFTADHPISQFREAYENMGSPTALELNAALSRYHTYMNERALSEELYQKRFFMIHHLGLSHYYDGVQDAGIPPGQTLHPNEISSMANPALAGGDLNNKSNKKSMRKWPFSIYDAFHLSKAGYERLAEHTFTNVIQYQLR